MPTYRLKDTGGWRKLAEIYRLKDTGNWRKLNRIYRLRSDGTWRRVFSSLGLESPTIENTVEISRSGQYHNSSNIVTLTGKKYHFANATTFEYRFYSSSDQNNWNPLNNDWVTTSNPASGASSNVTYQLTNDDFTSTTMYFQFRYRATNSSNVTTVSISTPVSVTYLEVPAPPPGFPDINQSTISVSSTASSGTWTGSPILYQWKWQYGASNNTLTYQATPSISSISLSGTTATATVFNHGFKSGDTVTVSGVNALFNQSSNTISSVFTNLFSYTISKPAHVFSTNYSAGQFVTYGGQIYISLLATPTPRAAWSSTTSYTTGQYVNHVAQLWRATGPSLNQTPIAGSDFWELIDIYPTSTTYWQSQQGSTASGGTATGPNYHEGSSSSPISYTISSFPSTDYKTGTALQGLTTRMNVTASNVAFTSSAYNSSARTIYGYPLIVLGTNTLTPTSASIVYSEANMDVYDLNLRRSVSVTSATVSGSNIIYTTSVPHSFSSSALVQVTGMSPSTFNISDIVVVSVGTNTFTITNTTGATGSSTAGGTALGTVSGYPSNNRSNSSPISITGLSSGSTYTAYITPKNADSPRVSGIQRTTTFTTPSPPVNTAPPTIGPLNNRSYLPVSTVLTATTGTWINVNANTTYNYNFQYFESAQIGWVSLQSSSSSNYTAPSNYTTLYGTQIRCVVTATNSDGANDSATSIAYNMDQAVVVGTISPTSANQNVATTFSFNISHYPTSYVVNWGDGTSDSYSVTANTSTVNASHSHTYTSSGTFTITVTAQPGSKTNTASVVVSAPLSFLFDANGGTLSSGPGNGQTSYTYTGAIGSTLTAPSATRQHYTISTWRSPLSGGTDPKFLSPGINYTIGSGELFASTTFYAIWTANTYTVTYNYNGGTGTPASASVQYPGSVTLPSPTRTNYTFNGWYTAASGGTFVGNGGSSYSPTSNITLFAQWTIIQYTVTWNANGGSVTPTSNTVNAGSSVTAPTPTRTGYTFSTWRNPLSGGDPITVAAGGSYTPTANITFFAIWIINTYTVSYNSNGATSGTVPANQTKTHDVTLTLATNSGNLQRTGYTFDGWYTNTSGTGGTAYAVGSNYTLNADLVLYAKWNIVQYTVTWDANGGTVSPPSNTVNAGSSVTAPTPTRSGFTFSTWRNPLSGGDPIFVAAGGTYTPTANITFYAIWTQTVPGPPRTVSLTRNQSSWNGTSWTWNCTWLAPNTGGAVSTYEAYREVGTGTVGNATLTTIQNTSNPQTGLTTTSTTFSTTVQAAPRADAYVRACNSGGCSSYVSGNVG